MKPLQVGLLMLAAAVGGGLLMKWENRETQPDADSAAARALPSETVTRVPVVSDESSSGRSAASRDSYRAKVKAERSKPPVSESMKVASTEPVSVPVIPPAASANTPQPDPEPAAPVKPESAPTPPSPPAQVTLSAGTVIAVRTIDSLSSDKNSTGDSFSASLTQPLVVDGFVIAERGARVEGKVVQSEKAGRVKGVSNLALQLTRITTADGQHIAIETETFDKQGQPEKTKDAAKVGGGAALGAIIGAIAGGGKGAGIGAGAGGAAGAGDVLLTRGKAVTIPSETPVSFRLRASVTITERR